MEHQDSNTNRPSRHPILDRLENNDYDFNGQSLDYEPNLEFDDTDLKQEIEEELEVLNANLMLNLGATIDADFERDKVSPDEEGEQGQRGKQEDESTHQVVVDNEAFIEHLRSQLYLQQSGAAAYLESPQDLLEENFEEAFKSSLFELEDRSGSAATVAAAAAAAATSPAADSSKLLKRAAAARNGKLNSFLRSATSGFYANKQNLLNESLEELKLDDDFENDDFSDIAQHNCVEVAGDDLFGRRIITIYACRLPSETKIHHLRLLKYIMYTLNQYVENDYCVVYFHYGLNSQNKPKLNFLYQAYKAFDRKYKKNLKALFLVHPTNFIRIVWQLFKPIIR